MKQIKIGWSEVNITPEKPIKLAGQFFERVSKYVESPLTVTAMAVTDGEEQAIFVSCDLVSISENLIAKVRNFVSDKNKEILTENIIIGAIPCRTR